MGKKQNTSISIFTSFEATDAPPLFGVPQNSSPDVPPEFSQSSSKANVWLVEVSSRSRDGRKYRNLFPKMVKKNYWNTYELEKNKFYYIYIFSLIRVHQSFFLDLFQQFFCILALLFQFQNLCGKMKQKLQEIF